MEQKSIEEARRTLGEIVDLARLAGQPTEITRQGKPAAVVVPVDWYRSFVSARQDVAASAREAMRGMVIHHKDGDPLNNDLDNLELVDPKENRP